MAYIALDVETQSLAAKHDATVPVWCVGFADETGARAVKWDDDTADYINSLEDNGHTFIFHNASFDVAVLRLHGCAIRTFEDTMAMSYVLHPENGRFHALGYLASQLGLPDKLTKPDFSQYSNELLEYNAHDAFLTYKIFFELKQSLEQAGLIDFYYEIERPYINVVLEMEQGVRVDIEALRRVQEQLKIETANLYFELQKLAGVQGGELKEYSRKVPFAQKRVRTKSGIMKTEITYVGCGKTGQTYDHCEINVFNPNSPKQVMEVLVKQYGWKPGKNTSVAKDILEELSYPIIPVLSDYRKLQHLQSGFIEPLLTLADADGIVHGNFNQFTTRTGRLSSSSPNLQNIPTRDSKAAFMRKVFIPRPNCKYVCGDLDRIEIAVLAYYLEAVLGSTTMSDAIRQNVDVHTVNAETWGIERAPAKNTIFCIIYGGSVSKIAVTAGIPLKQAKAIWRNIEKTMPELFELKEYVVNHAEKRGGHINDIFGRRYHISELNSPLEGTYQAGVRKVFNYLIQGTAGNVFKFLQLEARPHLLFTRQVLAVHDEAVYEVEDFDSWPEVTASLLTKMYTRNDVLDDGEVSVPVRATFKVGDSWYDAKG